ncbi:MAG: Rab family GTPase [Promethearchaeota archaeon]|jgi:small GTP-binding protein
MERSGQEDMEPEYSERSGQEEVELAYKICVFGESAVGKTSLVDRYLTNEFHENIQATLGATIHIKFMEVENGKITIQIWDFGGQKNFMFLIPSYAMGSSGAIFMFDLTNSKSFQNLNNWLIEFRKVSRSIPIILVGNKLDLEQERVCSKQEALEFMKNNRMFDYIETSAKSGENIHAVFQSLVLEILSKSGRDDIIVL